VFFLSVSIRTLPPEPIPNQSAGIAHRFPRNFIQNIQLRVFMPNFPRASKKWWGSLKTAPKKWPITIALSPASPTNPCSVRKGVEALSALSFWEYIFGNLFCGGSSGKSATPPSPKIPQKTAPEKVAQIGARGAPEGGSHPAAAAAPRRGYYGPTRGSFGGRGGGQLRRLHSETAGWGRGSGKREAGN